MNYFNSFSKFDLLNDVRFEFRQKDTLTEFSKREAEKMT